MAVQILSSFKNAFGPCCVYLSVLFNILFFLVMCKASSLDQDVICGLKWKDGGVLENEESWREMNKKCLETNMFDDRTIIEKFSVNSTLEEFIQVDDNCFVQCCYKMDNMLAADGTINKNETIRMFKGSLTASVLNAAITIWNDCITDSEKTAKASGANNCKMLTLHDFCFTKRCMEAGLFRVECTSQNSTTS